MGRDQEFTEYVGTRWPRLVRTAVLLGCPRAEAEAVVRDALVRCLTDWSQVRRADDRDAYVHRVLVERLRAAAKHRETEAPADRHDLVLDRLRRLPEDQRLAVVLCDYAGLDELQAATAARPAVGAGRGLPGPGAGRPGRRPQPVPPSGRRMSSPGTTALLERAADEVVVLAPPVEPMLAEADRLRRRRRTAVGGAVLAVLVTLGAADAVTSFVDPDPEAWPAAAPPDGMRFVGLGRAVIAVPTGWATDATRCGQPVRDTVVVGTAPAATCTASRPADVRSVVITSGPPAARLPRGDDVRRRGPAVERGRTTCPGHLHGGGARADGERHLHRRVVQPPARAGPRRGGGHGARRRGCWTGRVAVPGTGALAADYGRSAEAKYVADLRDLGLEPGGASPSARTGAEPGTVTGGLPGAGHPAAAAAARSP